MTSCAAGTRRRCLRADQRSRALTSACSASERAPTSGEPASRQRDKQTEGVDAAMSIGLSVFLIAVGAVISFALKVDDSDWFIDLNVLGFILMAAGAVGVLLTLMFWRRRRGSVAGRAVDEVETSEPL